MRGFLVLAIFSLSYGFYGHITKDTVWRDTVLITGDVVVDSGVCLKIEPGTVVEFLADSSEWDDSLGHFSLCDFIVNKGRLIAIGTSSDTILFTSITDTTNQSKYGDWQGIILSGGGPHILKYTVINSPSTGLLALSTNLIIEKSCITYAFHTGIDARQGNFEIIENVISYIGVPKISAGQELSYPTYGVKVYNRNKDSVEICENSILKGQGHSRDFWDGDNFCGISVDAQGYNLIRNNTIFNCRGGNGGYDQTPPWPNGCNGGNCVGISISGKSSIIEGNYITKCKGGNGYDAMLPGEGGDGIGIDCNSKDSKLIKNQILECTGGSGEFGGTGIGVKISANNVEVIENKIGENYRGIGVWIESKESDAKLSKNEISGNEIGILIGRLWVGEGNATIGGIPENQNDIFNNKRYNISNNTPNDIIATYNWWGTTFEDIIEKCIYDYNEDSRCGYVIYKPWAEEPLGVDERIRNKEKRIRLIAYPNPFREKIEIRWEMSKEASEPIRIYDISGRIVKSFASFQSPESKAYKVTWYGRDDKGKKLPSGIYFIKAENEIEKVILLRGDND